MSSMHAPVLILGGGPGGCSAALQLAKRGVEAVLVEKAVFPRDKVCGDALSGKVMRTLERVAPELVDRVKIDAHRMPSWGVTFVAPGGKSLRVPFRRETGIGEAPGAILPRLDFDDLLFQRVKTAPGITVLEGTAAKAFERIKEGWRVTLEDLGQSSITTPLILDASGANSHFARHVAGLGMEPRHHAAGVRAYYSNVKGLDADGFIELIFLKELLPGYLWVFPLPNGRANVGLGLRSDVVRKRKADLKKLLLKLLAEHPSLKERFAHATLDGPVQGMGLPLASKRRPLSGDGYLLIGDAGHLIDPFTGEGISHAMISGMHAADVACEALEKASQQSILPLLRRGHTGQGAKLSSSGEAERGHSELSAKSSSAEEAGSGAALRSTDAPIPHTLLHSYDARVWRRLGQELAISSRLQQLADKAWLFDFVVDRANKNPALADTISSMFTDLDLRARLKKPGFYMDLLLGRGLK
ncbi:MAG: geranylgeranyl reductase family protein [Flavobacteriales bacterium]|nr:geranylgeranyl reductase family protein [Flavobacteriales bacterium]